MDPKVQCHFVGSGDTIIAMERQAFNITSMMA